MERKSSSEIDGHLFPSPDVNDWPDEGVLLEIGTLLGRSAVVWAEAFEQTGKNYKIVTSGNEPIAPKDSFEQENSYYDSMLFAKRITFSDVARVIPNRVWTNGESYDMYKHNVDIDNVASVNGATNLYDSKFLVVIL